MDKRLPRRHPGFFSEKLNAFQPSGKKNHFLDLGCLGARFSYPYRKFTRLSALVSSLHDDFAARSQQELQFKANNLRQRLLKRAPDHKIAAEIFALVREQADRSLGQRHFDVQIIGGWVMLHGMVAEMATGEGKTLTATLPACFAALSGIPVHIITANDYLARRDAELMGPLYSALGISVGAIQESMDGVARKKVYGQDIVYCTNKEIVFDYLKDRLLLRKQSPRSVNLPLRRLCGQNHFERRLRLRGLHYAIVDEADSIFIDEAQTPLILSQAGTNGLPPEIYQTILANASRLQKNIDYTLQREQKNVTLTPQGITTATAMATADPVLLPYRRTIEFLTQKALIAEHLFANGQEYVVANDKIVIIGKQTGRTMVGRSWEQGLQQFIESKEGCTITSQPEPLARINYQNFFNRYHHLAGMTGTATEVARELWDVYRLHVITIPGNVPSQSRDLGRRLFTTTAEKNKAILRKVRTLQQEKRPVLIGTSSVSSSEALVSLLQSEGLPCTLLNARQDQEEAAIIARAGTVSQITVATNMAGRGTDIQLAPGVAEHGGLHVLASECANPQRIDRQLFGRCGRQGDPGSFEAIFSLEDAIFCREDLSPLLKLLLFCFQRLHYTKEPLARLLINRAQKNVERKQYLLRLQLLKQGTAREKALAFNRDGS